MELKSLKYVGGSAVIHRMGDLQQVSIDHDVMACLESAMVTSSLSVFIIDP
jgi:hypothetical protein